MIKPLGNLVLVKPIQTQQEHKSGLILTADTSRHVRGKVIALGPKADPLLSDKVVLFNKGLGSPVRIEPEDYLLLSENDLLGIFDE